MPILDFKEIPEAHLASGKQDSFELFARDYFEYCSYDIIEGPDRGVDEGRDIIIKETQRGVSGLTIYKWLVSCKHKAHSGRSVLLADETDIIERVKMKSCDGFIGFYSTIPSSSLVKKLNGLRSTLKIQYFDHEKIETNLFKSSSGLQIARRYFPNSFESWNTENPRPVMVFNDNQTLECEYCSKDLLLKPKTGIIVFFEDRSGNISKLYWSCKGDCDRKLNSQYETPDTINKWEDIPDICIPLIYLRWIMTTFNKLHSDIKYSDEAFEKLKRFFIYLYPHIIREQTSNEKERIQSLKGLLAFLGGLG